MKSMNKNGKTYWLFDFAEMEEVRRRINGCVGHAMLYPGEKDFIEQLDRLSRSGTFHVSNPQLTWLDAILHRCGSKPFGGGSL